MCTTFAKNIEGNWYLGKTRDPVEWMRWDDEIKMFNTREDRFKKWIIQNPNPKEDGFYGGINEKGVAFISTYVHVSDLQISYIRKPYVRLILDAATAEEAVEIISSFKPEIGGNMFISDAENCFGIESIPGKIFIQTIENNAVKTNHYLNFEDRNLEYDNDPHFEKWSKTRFERAEELLINAQSEEDLIQILRDRKNAENGISICRTDNELDCFTHSAFIFNCADAKALYCQGDLLKNDFKAYSFNS